MLYTGWFTKYTHRLFSKNAVIQNLIFGILKILKGYILKFRDFVYYLLMSKYLVEV